MNDVKLFFENLRNLGNLGSKITFRSTLIYIIIQNYNSK